MTVKCIEYINGDKCWYLNDQLHREDGPAIERANGSKDWCLNGKVHRVDGPAVEWADGYKAWYLDGKHLFALPQESQPFVFIEETEDGKQIKVLTPNGTELWPNLPGLKELAENLAATKQ